jgi:hypothetical protein
VQNKGDKAMKTTWFIVAFFAAATALGQGVVPVVGGSATSTPYLPPLDYGNGYDSWYHSSTAGEGYARGLGELFRSGGVYNLYSSAAAINLAEARRREIENDKAWVQAYFELRDYNTQKRDAQLKRDRGNPDDWTRLARAVAPKPLDSHDLEIVTGKLHWPILLTAREFAPQRATLEKLFADRAYRGILEAEDFVAAVHVTDDMLASLKGQINDVPSKQYLAARRFLESLAYEAGQPAG